MQAEEQWARLRREEFRESTAQGIYLNHAGVAPSPARVVRAVTEAVQWAGRDPIPYYMTGVIPLMETTRGQLARLLGVPAEHLALTKNTAHGLSIVADGLSLEPGDNVLVADCDYPAVVYPWKAQAWRGIEAKIVTARPDGTLALEDFAAAIDKRTRAIAVSWIQFGTGYRIDLAAFAKLAHSHNALLIVDVIQGLGALPLEAEKLGLDIVATGAHKWLMAPAGTGGLYIAPHALSQMNLVNMGALSVVNVANYDSLDFTPKPTAQRYEEGSPNALGLFGLNAALALIEEMGIDAIGERVLFLSAHAATLLESKGYEVTSPRDDAHRSGLVMFRHPDYSNEQVLDTLTAANVTAAVRGGRVRFAPHFYNTESEITAAVDALP